MMTLNICGHITQDAAIKNISGESLVYFTIAHNSRFKSGETWTEETEFIRCSIWGKPEQAKILSKGRPISATGVFKLNRYTDKQGQPQTALALRVSFFQVFSKGKGSSEKIESFSTTTPETQAAPIGDETDLPF